MLKLQSHYSPILTPVVLAWQPTKDQASRRALNAVLNISGGGGGGAFVKKNLCHVHVAQQ